MLRRVRDGEDPDLVYIEEYINCEKVTMLRRVRDGEDPDLVYIEEYINCEKVQVEDDENE